MMFLMQVESTSNGHGRISELEISVAALAKCAIRNIPFGSERYSKEWKTRRSGRQRRSLACVIVA